MTSQTIETTDLKNISWNEKRQAYIVYVRRFNQVFYKLAYSLEDAITLRDKVLEFFNAHKRKPTSKDLGLERKKSSIVKQVELPSVNAECAKKRSSTLKLRIERSFIAEITYAVIATEYVNLIEKFWKILIL